MTRLLLVLFAVACAGPQTSAPLSAEPSPEEPSPKREDPPPVQEPTPPPKVIEDPPVVDSPEPPSSAVPPGSEAHDADPLRAEPGALAYARRMLAFLKRDFKCPAVSPEEKKTCTPTAQVEIDDKGLVSRFTHTPCTSSAAINAAVESTLRSKVGRPIPPPPPDVRSPRSITMTFVCK
jgi:hypothetical protein